MESRPFCPPEYRDGFLCHRLSTRLGGVSPCRARQREKPNFDFRSNFGRVLLAARSRPASSEFCLIPGPFSVCFPEPAPSLLLQNKRCNSILHLTGFTALVPLSPVRNSNRQDETCLLPQVSSALCCLAGATFSFPPKIQGILAPSRRALFESPPFPPSSLSVLPSTALFSLSLSLPLLPSSLSCPAASSSLSYKTLSHPFPTPAQVFFPYSHPQ